VKFKLHPGLLVTAVVLLCAAMIGGIAWRRSRSLSTTRDLLDHIPGRGEAITLFVDFQALRGGGLLAMLSGTKVAEEPEYAEFVRGTGFDYQRDLDSALVSFQPRATLFLLRGRFDWGRLQAYVKGNRGDCHNTFCRLQGSTPERRISFFPLSIDVMALAVSSDSSAAGNLINRVGGEENDAVPGHPVWLAIPGVYLRANDRFPSGTRLFAKALDRADRVVLSLVASNGRIEALLEAECASARDASAIAGQLSTLTVLLRDMISRESQKPNPKDLSGVLTSGTFRSEDVRVIGRWPLPHLFLETLAGGSL
jgi:hypothetical protein